MQIVLNFLYFSNLALKINIIMPKNISQTINFTHYSSVNELNEADKNLCLTAKAILENAYAPYSQFYVGAAILLEDGTVVTGTNQENAAYPSGTCAERTAIFYAATQHPNKKINTIAIACKSISTPSNNLPISPCGACRQVIAEYEVKQDSAIKILMFGQNNEVYESNSLANLLPLMFNARNLE